MKKITKITPEQEAILPSLVERWVGYAGEKSSYQEVETAVIEIYFLMDKPKPLVLLAESPLASVFTAAALKLFGGSDNTLRNTLYNALDNTLDNTLGNTLDNTLRNTLDNTLRNTLGNTLYNTLGNTLDNTLRNTLGNTLDNTLRNTLRNTLYNTLYNTLDNTLDNTLRNTLGNTLRNTLDNTLYNTLGNTLDNTLGNTLDKSKNDKAVSAALSFAIGGSYLGMFWNFWAGYYEFAKIIGVQFDKKLYSIFHNFCKHVPHIVALEGIAIVSKKPTKIAWQERPIDPHSKIKPENMPKNRSLHADGEKAIEFADGFGSYVFNGVAISEKMGSVKSENWDANWILTEENQEIKRVLLENIPTEKVADILKLKTLDTYKTKVSDYELVEAQNNPYPSRYRALRMKCPSTDKPYLIRVHPDMESAEKAVVQFNGGVHPDSFIVEH